jgi:RNA polymerase sigma-70 factor (ECF subfamily)
LSGRRGTELDEATIREFLATDYRRLVAGLSLVVGSQALAEDAVQEALARAWERGDRGERIESLKAWVAVAAMNILRSGIRRVLVERRARRQVDSAGSPPSPGLIGAEERLDVEQALRALPRRHRQVIALHYFADLSLADIARAMETTEGAVKAALHRARRSLARTLGEEDPEKENDVVGLG